MTADTISRVKSSGKSMIIGNNKQDKDDAAILKAVINSIGTDLEALTWEKVMDWTHCDPNMVKLIEVIQNGFPDTCYELPKDIREYFQSHNELHMVDGAIC